MHDGLIEILFLGQAAATAVLAPLMADEPHGRHDIEHASPEVVRNALLFVGPAEFRIALSVLRPKPVTTKPNFRSARIADGYCVQRHWRRRPETRRARVHRNQNRILRFLFLCLSSAMGGFQFFAPQDGCRLRLAEDKPPTAASDRAPSAIKTEILFHRGRCLSGKDDDVLNGLRVLYHLPPYGK